MVSELTGNIKIVVKEKIQSRKYINNNSSLKPYVILTNFSQDRNFLYQKLSKDIILFLNQIIQIHDISWKLIPKNASLCRVDECNITHKENKEKKSEIKGKKRIERKK